MSGRQCYHCRQWVQAGEAHDCWTTTEAALTGHLSEDLREAWERLRETAADFGDQRIYASHHSIMFSRESCYFFVRPKTRFLEVCIFLGRTLRAPQVRRAEPVSKLKTAHMLRIQHRDQVEAPITDWLREAYELSGGRGAAATRSKSQVRNPRSQRKPPIPNPESRGKFLSAKPGSRKQNERKGAESQRRQPRESRSPTFESRRRTKG